jgi:iron complex outermembrane receptor protein
VRSGVVFFAALTIVLALPLKSTSNSLYDEDVVILDEAGVEEMTLTVQGRAVAPLSPSSRIIKADEFKGRFTDLPSVLETVSGVNVRSMGGYGQYAEGAIRGGAANGARVYLDGVLLNSAAGGAVDLSKVPLDRIAEIRVTKNTSGLRQMGAGMGGVIELFTYAVDELVTTNNELVTTNSELAATNNQLVTTNRKMLGVNFEAGSFGYVKGGMMVRAGGGKVKQQFNFDAAKSDNDYPFVHDNYTTEGTRRDPDPTFDDTLMHKANNYYRGIDAAYSLSVDISDRHKISQQAGAGVFEQGLFNYQYRENQSGSAGGRSLNYMADYRGEINSKLAIGGSASGVYRVSVLSDPDAHFSLGGAKELEAGGGRGDFLFDAKYALTENFYLAGLAAVRFEGYAQRNRALSGKAEMSRREYRAGAELGLKAKAVESVLRAAYKYETDTSDAGRWYLSPEGRKRELAYPLAEAEFLLNLSPAAVRLSASASKRSPSFFERFGWGSGFVPNPDLKEETRVEADAGASVDIGYLSAAASVFAGTVGDKIKSIPRGGSFVKVMNFADTKFYGAEIDVNSRPLQNLTAELSAAYMKSVISGAVDRSWVGKIEPFIPEFSGFLKTEADVWKFNIGHGVKYESGCYRSVENILKMEPQIELSAWAACRVTEFLTLRYRVENYTNTANFDFLDNPKPRRTHVVSAALNI